MKGKHLLDQINIALDLLPERMRGEDAARLILAICYHESGLRARIQHGTKGTLARGFAQFERIGIMDVLMRHSSHGPATDLCAALDIRPEVDECHEVIAWNDVLMAGFARLNLWNDPHPFPQGKVQSWETYLRVWRPGKPHPERWAGNWRKAQEV